MMDLRQWPEDRIERLRALVDDGLTASQIAPLLGVSRSSVIGKISRLGLILSRSSQSTIFNVKDINPKRTIKPRHNGVHFVTLKMRAATRKINTLPMVDFVSMRPSAQSISLMNLQLGQCRWPLGETKQAGFGFCGAPVMIDATGKAKSYCAEHARLAYCAVSR